MKRYDIIYERCAIDQVENGGYVLYSDAQAEITRLQGEVRAEHEAFEIEWEHAEKLTAEVAELKTLVKEAIPSIEFFRGCTNQDDQWLDRARKAVAP